MLDTWNDGPAKSAIVDFVGQVTNEGPHLASTEERVAVFDNDGTMWCEKLHDDAEREFDYTAGAEKALTLAEQQGWTVTSMRNDWTTVFTANGVSSCPPPAW